MKARLPDKLTELGIPSKEKPAKEKTPPEEKPAPKPKNAGNSPPLTPKK